MKICIAQIASAKGKIQENIKNHLQFIDKAIGQGADLIIFPELSITGYEPTLAAQYATNENDTLFDIFQEQANLGNITICIGMPLKTKQGITIGMIILQPFQERTTYAKNLLHSDELPYFVPGDKPFYLNIKEQKIALGICYETLQPSQFTQATKANVDIYIASVAKSQNGIDKALSHFPKMAKEHNMHVLMSNAIGPADNFIGAGQSAIWNNGGILVNQLNKEDQGLLYFDTLIEDSSVDY